jgi:hypothetical protein
MRRLAIIAAAAAFVPSTAHAQAADPALRGLDVFVHGPNAVVAGDTLFLDLRAYGFGTVTRAAPLSGATITAAWNPESLGPNVPSVPPDVVASTDADGLARISVPVPSGDARTIALLLAVRHGEHVRTRAIAVMRKLHRAIDLHVPDTYLVPGSNVPVWLTVSDARTGKPATNAGVELALLEGDIERTSQRLVTDATGLARTHLAVPAALSGVLALSLRARTLESPPRAPAEAVLPLGLREETPAMPRVSVSWRENELRPGDAAHAEIRLLDATDEPIAGHEVRWWIGPKGTTPPKNDDEWRGAATAKTDGLGVIVMTSQAPRVVTAQGSELTLVVRTDIEGQHVEQRRVVPVGAPVASAEVEVEGGALVPSLTQRVFLRVTDGGTGIAGTFDIAGDGLRARVTTDAFGEGELTWAVPAEIGAARQVGPCAGGVAAALSIRAAAPIPTLHRTEPFEACVPVARDRTRLIRPSVHVARIGETVRASWVGPKSASSMVLTGVDGIGTAIWSTDGEARIEASAPGLHTISATMPQDSKASLSSAAQVLVVPRVLPKLRASAVGGRLAPGGEVEVETVLDDGHGHPLAGTVAAVLVDREGGGSVAGLERFDTRLGLCERVGAPRDRCDAFLEGDAETLRRRLLGGTRSTTVEPALDPAAHAEAQLRQTFSDVLHSLEGAVYEADTPESLRDVRRKERGRSTWNPELMTLVTGAMNAPPTTPGGEPFSFADLAAVDPQVSFDVVARRVTRMKLFNVLAAIRSYRASDNLGEDEPALRDPDALLRRLVRSDRLSSSALLDPWGGTMGFVRTTEAPLPFLGVARGYALHSPGPDGLLGTADDIKDPFERVLRSRTPYADAMGEDEIVDARLDMRVSDATVSAWQEMFARFTGTGLGGGGTGEGYGNGHGRLGGSHVTRAPAIRGGQAIVTDTTRWTEPVATDASGHARIRLTLGDAETTWRVAVLARTNDGQTAVTTLDVPAFLPLSARVDLGRKLSVGDEVGARVIVRNRTAAARRAKLDPRASGAIALVDPRTREVDVPPNAVRSVFVRVKAHGEGEGRIDVAVRAGEHADQTSHTIAVEPPGEPRLLGAAWTLPASGARRMNLHVDVPLGYTSRGDAELVVESGSRSALVDALASLEPQPTSSPDALADAIEVASRIRKLAEAEGDRTFIERVDRTKAFAHAFLEKHAQRATAEVAAKRAALFVRRESDEDECVKSDDGDPLAILEAEPAPGNNGPLPCFTERVAKVDPKSTVDIARVVFATIDRPHRAFLAAQWARELAKRTHALREPIVEGARSERAIVLAALARTVHVWSSGDDPRLVERLLSLRDARGGYGSSEATRDVVRLLTSRPEERAGRARVVATTGKRSRTLEVAPNGRASIVLGAGVTAVDLDSKGAAATVRLVRPMLRPFTTPDSSLAPVTVTTDWPNRARAGSTAVLHVGYRLGAGRPRTVETTIPLPPGVALAGPTNDVTTRQGVLRVRAHVTSNETIAIPIRFTLPGKLLVREAITTTLSEESERAVTPARVLEVD